MRLRFCQNFLQCIGEKYLYAKRFFENISKIVLKEARAIKSRGCQGRPKPTARELRAGGKPSTGWHLPLSLSALVLPLSLCAVVCVLFLLLFVVYLLSREEQQEQKTSEKCRGERKRLSCLFSSFLSCLVLFFLILCRLGGRLGSFWVVLGDDLGVLRRLGAVLRTSCKSLEGWILYVRPLDQF